MTSGYFRECPGCRRRWPWDTSYRECPICEVQTRPTMGNGMTAGQAKAAVRAAAFESFYLEREGQREGPDPEELGRQEARVEMARLRKLEADYEQS